MSDIRTNSDVDIGLLPISEWRFSVWHICLRYRNNRCRCRMSDIADIKINVDAHLCSEHWRPSCNELHRTVDNLTLGRRVASCQKHLLLARDKEYRNLQFANITEFSRQRFLRDLRKKNKMASLLYVTRELFLWRAWPASNGQGIVKMTLTVQHELLFSA